MHPSAVDAGGLANFAMSGTLHGGYGEPDLVLDGTFAVCAFLSAPSHTAWATQRTQRESRRCPAPLRHSWQRGSRTDRIALFRLGAGAGTVGTRAEGRLALSW